MTATAINRAEKC